VGEEDRKEDEAFLEGSPSIVASVLPIVVLNKAYRRSEELFPAFDTQYLESTWPG